MKITFRRNESGKLLTNHADVVKGLVVGIENLMFKAIRNRILDKRIYFPYMSNGYCHLMDGWLYRTVDDIAIFCQIGSATYTIEDNDVMFTDIYEAYDYVTKVNNELKQKGEQEKEQENQKSESAGMDEVRRMLVRFYDLEQEYDKKKSELDAIESEMDSIAHKYFNK